MARGLNRVLLIGNLGADPEIKFAPSGTAIANFNLATTEGKKNANGEWEDATEWHRIVFFGRQAESCRDYLKKGSRIYMEGRIQTRSWEDQSGQRQYRTEIVGASFLMLDGRAQDGDSEGAKPREASPGKPRSGSRQPSDSRNMPEPPKNNFPEGDDDLPF